MTAEAGEATGTVEPDTAARPCVLGVERSLNGRRWEERGADLRQTAALVQQLALPEVVARVLAARGVTAAEAPRFLEPRLRDYLPDPSCLKDMDAAVARLQAAVEAGEQIAIFGDYDVDGATAGAVLGRFLRRIGVEPRFYVPDRIAEGYGPNSAALLRLRREGAAVLVTVDCGVTAFEPLAAAAASGLDVIVLDHHAAEPRLPEAVAVVNPNRLDEPRGAADPARLTALAAVGVAFLLIVALNRRLREADWYRRNGREEPDLRDWLDLVALGTVCDVVPLVGLNRALVAQGLKVMARRGNPGLAALADVARMDSAPAAYHAGFVLGPRVNAGGRVGAADLGTRLLTTDNAAEAAEIAQRLEALNAERQRVEAEVLEAAMAQVEDAGAPPAGLVFAAGNGWHPGVIGIVAGRLKERFNRPALVIALDAESGQGKGSGRSVPGVDLGAAVLAARQAGLLVNGGGHPMAAGLTVSAERLSDLRAFLDERLAAAMAAVGYRPSLGLDGLVQPGAATVELLRALQAVGPFGAGNAQPRFALPAMRVVRADEVGRGHVRCILSGADGARLKGIAFRALGGALGAALLRRGGPPLHLAGRLDLNSWNGRESVQLIIEDAAAA